MAARFISTRPNFASRAPLARPSLLARLYRSCQEELLFGDACSEVVACPHEQYWQPPDMTQIVPRGGERVRAERPPHGQSEPPAFECGPVPCSPASSQPRRPAFGGACCSGVPGKLAPRGSALPRTSRCFCRVRVRSLSRICRKRTRNAFNASTSWS
jgi:hypothetical protein